MLNDLRYSLRMLLKSPGFTAVAVLSLALGIGAGTAIFSLVNAILLRGLSVPNPQELRVIEWSGADTKMEGMGTRSDVGNGRVEQDGFSYPLYLSIRKQCAAQADIFAYTRLFGITARARHEAVSTEGLMVSDNFFSGLQAQPLIGRLLDSGDDRPGASPAAVISYNWWERQFDLDPGALGQQITINSHPFTVVGILPRELTGIRPGTDTDIYVSMVSQPVLLPNWPLTARDRWWVPLLARLKPGVSDSQLRAALEVAFNQEAESYMKQPQIVLINGSGGPEGDRNLYREPLFMILGIVGVVLLVACANLAGLLLARGAARQHDFSVRAALGAGRWRLIRQSLTESLIIALLGGGIGIVIANWGKPVIAQLLALSPTGLRYDTSIDLKVLVFTLTAALITALLSGLLPALQAARVDPLAGLKARGTLATPRIRSGRILVCAQIALSLLLVAGAGLYARTLGNLQHVNPGFATENLLLCQLNPENGGYQEPQTTLFYNRVLNSLGTIPGVSSAALTRFPLLGHMVWTGSSKGYRNGIQAEHETYELTISESFFATMGIPILLGRDLQASDAADSPKVVVVNKALVHQYFGDENPIGQMLETDGVNARIVGVCGDAKYSYIKEDAPPTAYFSYRQNPTGAAFFALRTTLPPLAVTTAVRHAVAAIDPNIPLTDISTQEQIRDQTIGQERMFATLGGSLAILALLLSCIGLFGLMAYNVTRRTAEIGIRMALGATRKQIARPILREAMLLVAIGVAIGTPLSLALTRLIRSSLFGVEAADPITFGGAIVLIIAVSLIAAWLPARRAAKVDPMIALRCE